MNHPGWVPADVHAQREASKLFYEELRVTAFAASQSQNWLTMKNGEHAIGLFQGMFANNIYRTIR